MIFFRKKKTQKPTKVPKYVKTTIGGVSGMFATAIAHPLDLVKTRMQLYSLHSSMSLASKIVRCEGPRALYVGLSAAFMRQATYTTTRIAAYHWIYENYKRWGTPSVSDKVLIGVYASLAGAVAGGPADIALVRMMAEGHKDPCDGKPYRRHYKNVFDAIYKIAVNEGFKTLWRGGTLSLIRATLVGTVQIGSYTKTRDYLLKRNFTEGIPLHCYASTVSGFITAIVTLPVDRIKMSYQVRRDVTTQGEIFYRIYSEGVLSFWHGFLPYFVRLSVHTAVTYICMYELTQLYLARVYPDIKR